MAIRVVSWNIAKRQAPWHVLAAMDADIALIQEAGQPPTDLTGLDIGPKESYDSHHWNSDWWHGRGWKNLYERWPMVVKLSDRVDVEWFKQVGPIAGGNADEIEVSGIGTITAARVTPKDGSTEPFIVISMYGRWMGPHPSTGSRWILSDVSAHRIISDLSAFVGREDTTTHRIIAAGDLNLFYGYGDDGSEYWRERYNTIFDRMKAIGIEFIGPQAPNGRQAEPRMKGEPEDSRNVVTYYTSSNNPQTADNRQLDYVFASRGFHESINVRALNEIDEWGPSDHCRILIEIDESHDAETSEQGGNMATSENDSLLGHIAVRHTVGKEDVATSALSFIVNRSDSAKAVLSTFLGDDSGSLPVAKSSVQSFLEASGAYPDMALRDADNNLLAYVESKFWANLTDNQPVTYWEALPTDRRSALLFIAPQYRVNDTNLWEELVDRLRAAGHELGEATRSDGIISASAIPGQRRLMLTSWKHLLGLMAAKAKQDGERQTSFEIAELQGLARAVISGKRDTSGDDFRILLAEVVGALRESGWANTDGLTVGQGLGFYGRYMRLAGAYVWLGSVTEVTKNSPDKPLWLSFYSLNGDVKRDEARTILRDRVEHPKGFQDRNLANVPVPFPEGKDDEAILERIVNEIEQIAKIIDPNGPTYGRGS